MAPITKALGSQNTTIIKNAEVPVIPNDSIGVVADKPVVNVGTGHGVTDGMSSPVKAPVVSPANDYDILSENLQRPVVPLPKLLSALGESQQGQALLNGYMNKFQEKTSLKIPDKLRAEILKNPASLTKLFERKPSELKAALVGLNEMFKSGKVSAPAPAANLIAGSTFDLGGINALTIERPKSEMKQLLPGLYQGDLPSTASDGEVKQNRVMAEVFDRLAHNSVAEAKDKLSVTINGKQCDTVDALLNELKADGYSIDVVYQSRIANFADFKTPAPGSPPENPVWLDVPAPVMAKTGITDGHGNEAIVPMSHSEMIISLKPGPDSKLKVPAQIKFFQGISGTGFFPANVWAEPEWCGRKETAHIDGAKPEQHDTAFKAISLAGTQTEIIATAAKKRGLKNDGYGVTGGVCNDSVADNLVALNKLAKTNFTPTQYPLFMSDSQVRPTVRELIAKGTTDNLVALQSAIHDLPSDVRATKTTAQRAKDSLPWAEGKAPFAVANRAAEILSGKPAVQDGVIP